MKSTIDSVLFFPPLFAAGYCLPRRTLLLRVVVISTKKNSKLFPKDKRFYFRFHFSHKLRKQRCLYEDMVKSKVFISEHTDCGGCLTGGFFTNFVICFITLFSVFYFAVTFILSDIVTIQNSFLCLKWCFSLCFCPLHLFAKLLFGPFLLNSHFCYFICIYLLKTFKVSFCYTKAPLLFIKLLRVLNIYLNLWRHKG